MSGEIRCGEVVEDDLARFLPLTYPRYRELLKEDAAEGDPRTLRVGAWIGGEPAGLVLAQVPGEGDDPTRGVVLSVFVVRDRRRAGVGSAMLAALAELAKGRGAARLELSLEDREDLAPARALLEKGGYGPFEAVAWVGRVESQKRLKEARWYGKRLVPATFDVVPWAEVDAAARDRVRARGAEGWYPEELSPFRYEEAIEPLNSIALMQGDEVLGWQINHRIAPDTIRYSSLFVDDELQAYGLALALEIESVRLHLESPQVDGIPRAVFLVYTRSEGMLRHAEKNLAPYLDSFRPLLRAARIL